MTNSSRDLITSRFSLDPEELCLSNKLISDLVDLLVLFLTVYADLGFGFATGCLIIIAEIIYRKLTRPGRLNSGCGTILLLLLLSAILIAVTAWNVDKYYAPVPEWEIVYADELRTSIY